MIERILRISLILIGAWIVKKIIYSTTRRLNKFIKKTPLETISQKRQRVKTLTSLLQATSGLVVNGLTLLLILSEFNVDITPLLTGVGILGLAVGFGARSLIADFIAGFFILLENQFNIGDEVNLGNNWQGRVIKLSLRTTTLKNKKGEIYIIPNSQIKAVKRLA